MEDFIQAINSNDLVKFKKCFAEAMKEKIDVVLNEHRLALASSILVAGEINESDEDEDEDEDTEDDTDDEDEDEDDEE